MTKPCCGVPVQCLEPDAECVTREMHQRQTLKDSLPRGIYRVGLTGGGEDVVEKCTDGWVHSDDDQGNPGAPFTGDILWANPLWTFKQDTERPIYHPLASAADMKHYDAIAKGYEVDPLGRNPHEPGAKLDAGKRRDGLVLLAFARALAEVSKVGTYGAQKYTENGWIDVPDGVSRYTDAMLRHMLAEASGESADKDTGLPHAAHAAWNALARLDPMVRNAKTKA